MSNIITNRMASVKRVGDCLPSLNVPSESKPDDLIEIHQLIDQMDRHVDEMIAKDDLDRINGFIRWLGGVFQKVEPHRARLMDEHEEVAEPVVEEEPCTESAFCGLCPPSTEQEAPMQTILEEAQKIVNGQRREDYGDIRTSFKRIAAMWAGYLGAEVNMFDVAHMMIMLKLSRNHDRYNKDSMVDVCGYAYCADIIHDKELAETSRFNGEF